MLRTVCDYDAGRVQSFDARFSAPVYPGDEIATDIWSDGDVVSFRCRVPGRDVVVLKNRTMPFESRGLANAGADMTTALKQVNELGLTSGG